MPTLPPAADLVSTHSPAASAARNGWTRILSQAGSRIGDGRPRRNDESNRSHTRVGRFTVIDTGHATEKLSDGSPAITAEELGRLERRAALTVLSEVDAIDGSELKFARKALGLTQAELARHLGVTTETVCRWETGKEEFKRQTQLAVLRLLEQVERHGEDVLAQPAHTHGDRTLRAKAS